MLDVRFWSISYYVLKIFLKLSQVAWKYYYSSTSAGVHGTMYQLRNLIGRSNVSPKPVKAFNQCSDFFKLVVVCHVLAAALKHLNMVSLTDTPNLKGVQDIHDLWLETAEKRKEVLRSVCGEIVDRYVCFHFQKVPTPSNDKVHFVQFMV